MRRTMAAAWRCGAWLVAWSVCAAGVAAELESGPDHIVVDGVRIPFDATLEIEGPITGNESFIAPSGAAVLRAWRINGKATQAEIDFSLAVASQDLRKKLWETMEGDFYKVRARLANARFNGTRNTCLVVVERFEPTPKITLGLADFVDREATFEGTAAPGGKLRIGNSSAALADLAAWPAGLEGKLMSVTGTVRRAADGFRFDAPRWTKARLEDRLGEEVVFDGNLYSLNGVWYYIYQGEQFYLTRPEGPTWRFNSNSHGEAVRVSGKLARQDRPSLGQISLKSDRDLVPTFVVRGAKIERREKSAGWEQRFGTLYLTRPKISDGVPELIAEADYRRGLMGNETSAMMFRGRNWDSIDEILRAPAPKTLDVLAARMNDAKLALPLRLLYAAMLAHENDVRGREFLVARAKPDGKHLDDDALYCLGAFPYLGPANAKKKPDLEWCIEPMFALMTNAGPTDLKADPFAGSDGEAKTLTVAEAVDKYSSIGETLMASESGRKRLREFALTDKPGSAAFRSSLLGAKEPLPIEAILKFEATTKDSGARRALLRELLRHPKPTGLERFLTALDESFVYADLRDHLTPEVVAMLRPLEGKVTGDAATHLRMLLVLGEKDPVPELLRMLALPNGPDRNSIVFELGERGDGRVVAPLAKILREAPVDYFGKAEGLAPTTAVINTLDAIAHTGTAEAIAALIELLDVDLARFGGYIDRAGFRRTVAAHLIELSGESFGTDTAAWRRWREAHPTHSVKRELANPRSAFRTDATGRIDMGQ